MKMTAPITSSQSAANHAVLPSDIVLASGNKYMVDVLLVEDDPVDQAIIKRNLGRSRFFETQISVSHTLEHADQMIRSVQFDIVILDFWVNGMSSLPLLDTIRREFPVLVPIMLSSVDVTDVHGLGMSFGAMGYLHKSDLTSTALDAVLRTALQQQDQVKSKEKEVAALIHSRLRADERMAEAAHEAISSLTAIIGFAEALSSQIPNLDTEAYPDLIMKGSMRTAEILKRYMPRQGDPRPMPELEFVLADVHRICSEAVQSMQQTCKARGQKLVISNYSEGLEAEVDPIAIYQSVFNLVENASKYSPPDTAISVSVTADEKSVVIGVDDQGIGMTSDEIDIAKRRHGRIPSPSELTIAGSGLGLTIVQSIVAFHLGELTIKSEKNMGSQFSIILPRKRHESSMLVAAKHNLKPPSAEVGDPI